jgi:UDPglucose 6-dehydrogenase
MEKVRRALWVVKEKHVGVLGLAFKPNTDDIRFAPAIEVVRRLLGEGAKVRATDPVAIERATAVLPGVTFLQDPYEVARNADALLLLTEWNEYRQLDWKRVHDEMARPLVLDARNVLSPAQMKALGFEYHSFGRPDLSSHTVFASS